MRAFEQAHGAEKEQPEKSRTELLKELKQLSKEYLAAKKKEKQLFYRLLDCEDDIEHRPELWNDLEFIREAIPCLPDGYFRSAFCQRHYELLHQEKNEEQTAPSLLVNNQKKKVEA